MRTQSAKFSDPWSCNLSIQMKCVLQDEEAVDGHFIWNSKQARVHIQLLYKVEGKKRNLHELASSSDYSFGISLLMTKEV